MFYLNILCVVVLLFIGCLINRKKKRGVKNSSFLAEKERFELSNPVTGYTISNRAPSTS